MIRLNGVSKYFNRRKSNEIRAIDNTSIELGNSGLVTFLGNSGCGKTTLLNAIGGLDKVDKGDIYIDDERMTRRSESKRDELRNLNIGYIFQNYNLIEDDTVFDNVAIVLRMTGMKDKGEIEERVMFVLRRLGIDKYRNRPVKALSGGERQRVGIARAIVKNPKIIIADEPTGNLDSRNTIEIMNIIKAISREKLVILVTHERDIAEFYADRVVEIVDGRIVSDRENHPAEDLDYRLENKIYLRDLPVSEELTSPDGLKISYYSDRKVQPDSIKVVIKSGNVYVYTDERLSYGSESMEIVDDHYRKISKDVYEDYDFNYRGTEGFVPKYTSIYTMGSSLATGFRKIRSYSVIKKILLIGFVLASMFIIYAVSNIAGITNITDDKFLTVNRDYLTVKTGALSEEQLEKYADMDGMDYVLPGDSMVTFIMPLGDYFQSNGGSTTVEGSLAATDKIPADSVVSGKLPEKDGELVIDKLLADRLLNKGGYSAAIQVGIDSYEDLIGRTLQIPGYRDYTISAVADTGSPCIYAARDELLDITVNRMSSSEAEAAMYGETGTVSEGTDIKPYSAAAGNDEIKIVSGTAPEEDYQVLLPEEMRYEYYIGSKIDTKVNDTRLTVSGFYSDARMGGAYYVSDHTKLISVLSRRRRARRRQLRAVQSGIHRLHTQPDCDDSSGGGSHTDNLPDRDIPDAESLLPFEGQRGRGAQSHRSQEKGHIQNVRRRSHSPDCNHGNPVHGSDGVHHTRHVPGKLHSSPVHDESADILHKPCHSFRVQYDRGPSSGVQHPEKDPCGNPCEKRRELTVSKA